MPERETSLVGLGPQQGDRLEALRRASAAVERALRERYPASRGYSHHKVDDAASINISFRNMFTVFRGLTWGLQLNLQSNDLQKLFFGVGLLTRLSKAVMWVFMGGGGLLGFLAPFVYGETIGTSHLAHLLCAFAGLAVGAVVCFAVLGLLHPVTSRMGASKEEVEKLYAELLPLVDGEISGGEARPDGR